ncbi:MAG: hypothetical protein WCT12_11085 [Verrucomicrobiota bacterium]|jgi:hypothetical protein
MRTTCWMCALVAGLILGGCKKSETAVMTREFSGVQMDWPKLDVEFVNVSPDLQAQVSLVKRAFRYSQFPQAIVELEKLAKFPNLTAPQQKLVSNLLEQTRQVMAKAPPPGQ